MHTRNEIEVLEVVHADDCSVTSARSDYCSHEEAEECAKEKGGTIVTLAGEHDERQYGVIHGDRHKNTWFLVDDPNGEEVHVGHYAGNDAGDPVYHYKYVYARVPRKYFPILGEAKKEVGQETTKTDAVCRGRSEKKENDIFF